MKRVTKISLGIAGLLLFAAAGVTVKARSEALGLISNPPEARHVPPGTPAERHLVYDDVRVKTADGLTLVGWFIPSPGHPVVILQHGYKDYLANYLGVAELLHRHGYAVLVPSLRAHDRSDGVLISFGLDEMKDLDAWYGYLLSRHDVDPQRIGMLGVSMGGAVAIDYAARNPHMRAVIADCAFSSIHDTVATSVRFFTGLPAFPFAPMILFWIEHDTGWNLADADAKRWIGKIGPRPVLLLQGGADVVISPDSGQVLYAAARQPKELWFEPDLGHTEFFKRKPEEFERRVDAFFDRYLGPGSRETPGRD